MRRPLRATSAAPRPQTPDLRPAPNNEIDTREDDDALRPESTTRSANDENRRFATKIGTAAARVAVGALIGGTLGKIVGGSWKGTFVGITLTSSEVAPGTVSDKIAGDIDRALDREPDYTGGWPADFTDKAGRTV